MFRFLLSSVFIFALLFTALAVPGAAAPRRCEERMPLTLLSLYRTSDSIYAGRYDKTVDGEATEDTPEYRVIPIKKHFSISSALKGETRKMLVIEDTEYRYKEQSPAPAEEEAEHVENEFILKPGDSVLLFVAKNAETGAIELADMTDGVKKMTPDMLKSYEARIRDLKSIFSSEKPKYSRIVDYLIRAADDPHTRWEGTFELLQSFQNLEWQEERAKQAKDNPESEEGYSDAPKEFDTGDPNFAKHVTDAHKQALTQILLKRERPKKTEEGESSEGSLAHGDRELIELVKRWGDSNVASNLLEQLRYDSSDVSLNSELMSSIASVLRDSELNTFSEEYANIQWESDEDEVITENQSATESGAAISQPGQPTVETKPSDAEPLSEVSGAKLETKKKKTYGELRSELMSKFLDRADKVIAKERDINSAKLHRKAT